MFIFLDQINGKQYDDDTRTATVTQDKSPHPRTASSKCPVVSAYINATTDN